MSRILWVTDEPPDRSRGGGSIRQANLLQRVAAAHEVHLVTTNAVDDTRAVADVASTTLVGAPPPAPPTTTARRAVDLARAAVTGGPAGLRATQGLRELMLPSVLRLAADVDLVCVEHDWLAPLGLHVRHVPTSLTLHYLPSQRADQWSQSAPSALRRLRWAEEARRLRRLEADWVAGYDGVVVVSEDDRRDLGTGVLIPNGVDTDLVRPTPLPTTPSIVLTGSFNYQPNVDGATWFVREVLPRIREHVPDASVALVGRQPTDEVRRLDDGAGVRLHADVPSVLPYLAAAKVAVVPLRVGSGTRLKALEALAAGRPVVGTTIGLAGLDLDEHTAVAADDPAAFAAGVVRVLQDDALAAAMASAGRAHVEAHFGWDRIGADYAAYLEDLATSAAQQSTSP